MIKEALRRSIYGIAMGGIATFIAITILKFTGTHVTVSEIWFHMLLSFILGIYFGLSSLIFSENGMSILKQTVIHFMLSIVVYFIVAFIGEWVPFTPFAIIISALIFTAIYSFYWTGYYLYYTKVAEKLNENLNRLDRGKDSLQD